MRITREQVEAALALVEKYGGSQMAAADAAGIPETSFRRRVGAAARFGLAPLDPVAEGFFVDRVSTQRRDGKVYSESIRQRLDTPPDELLDPVPDGMSIKRVSSLIGPGGIVHQWQIATRDDASVEDTIKSIRAAFDDYKGSSEIGPRPEGVQADDDLFTVYNIADHHLGMLAWGKETGGEDYDLHIAEKILLGSTARLIEAAPPSPLGIVLDLGDFLHSDSNENRTRRSGNALDTDTRYAKSLQTGVKLKIAVIEAALQKHDKILVRFIPGNHDPLAALALSVAIAAFFDGNDRVEVDTDPGPFFCRKLGKVLLFAAHGDTFKADQTPGVVAANWPREWGETLYRYAYLGHVHHASKGGGEHHGITYETFRTLAPRDAWHFGEGYSSGRSMVAITLSREGGEVMRHTVNVPRPQTAIADSV